MTTPAKIPWPALRRKLAAWYATAARDLPWRRTRDPYAIALSEVMLQQTQVATVIPYYQRWLKIFPTWTALAAAREHDVLKAWEGLGYYRRARNFHALAKAVAARGGELPRTEAGLRALPGIGPYTAAAIGSIAFGLPHAVLDGNVMRVLARVLALSDDIARPQTRAKFQKIADAFLDPKNSSTHNQALMELGATVCLPRKPMCLICPLRAECRGRDRAEDFPVKSRIAQEKRTETVAVLERGHAFYCEQVPAGKPWHGLWRFPDFDPARMVEIEPLAQIKYGITKYSVTMRAVRARWKKRVPPGGTYLSLAKMQQLAFAAPHKKLARQLG
ncbi:MAG TPA: A/G-specific adenine glycosylase [Candidatus Methylacidiphilales bacterium]|nr:A/G-specific adenine glycosylase [Candidatus Methylacidiphilales bacterium]